MWVHTIWVTQEKKKCEPLRVKGLMNELSDKEEREKRVKTLFTTYWTGSWACLSFYAFFSLGLFFLWVLFLCMRISMLFLFRRILWGKKIYAWIEKIIVSVLFYSRILDACVFFFFVLDPPIGTYEKNKFTNATHSVILWCSA